MLYLFRVISTYSVFSLFFKVALIITFAWTYLFEIVEVLFLTVDIS